MIGKPEEEYKPINHITVGELRMMGYNIDEKFPDCAWSRRDDLRFSVEAKSDDESSRRLSIGVTLETGLFRWTSLDLEVDV